MFVNVDASLAVALAAFLFAYCSYTAWTSRTMSYRISPGPNRGGFGGVFRAARPQRRDDTKETPSENATESATHKPSVADVLVVKAMLTRALSLPPELVDTIVDVAEYWPHTTTRVPIDGDDAPLAARGGSDLENLLVIRSPPLGLHNWKRVSYNKDNNPVERKKLKPQPPGEEFSADDFQKLIDSPIALLAHPCRRIVFTIDSRDQGWGGNFADHGTYNGSWTWFEVGLERWCKNSPAPTNPAEGQTRQRQQEQHPSLNLDDLCTVIPQVGTSQETGHYVFEHPLHPSEHLKIQCNKTAENTAIVHRVVWSYTDDIDPGRDVEAAAKLAEQGRGKATGNGKFVRDLKLGDVVTVWAKARFPSWVNYVESLKMDVYYAI